MDKMKCESPDLTQANIARLAELFPSVVTEARGEDGKLKKAVNFEALRQLMPSEVLDGDESYEFTWVGKKSRHCGSRAANPQDFVPVPARIQKLGYDGKFVY